MNALIIEGLNMKALNSLIWALAVLTKVSVVGVILGIGAYALLILISALGWTGD